jgi:methylmalonic aciduria homocystinuria type C protein
VTINWNEITERMAVSCAAGGIDLVQPLQVGWYNQTVDAEYRLPDFGDERHLALCIGNSRAMWQPFLDYVAGLEEVPDNPVDRYAESVIVNALDDLDPPVHIEVRYAPEPPPRRVAMQRLAQAAGLARLARSHLSVHPVYGPWIGLRAAIVFGVLGPNERPAPLESVCDCSVGCQPALERALAAGGDTETQWELWVAVRDACPVGREHRYSDRQIRYHYTKDRDLLYT